MQSISTKCKQQRNKVTSILRSSKKKNFQQLMTSSQNSKLIWKTVNKLGNKSDSKRQPIQDI